MALGEKAMLRVSVALGEEALLDVAVGETALICLATNP